MTEPWELIDETELLFYEIVRRQLKRQQAALFANPALVFDDTFWAEEAREMNSAILPFLIGVAADAIRFSIADLASVVDIDPVIEGARTFATQFVGEQVTRINSVTRTQVQDLLARSIDEQWGLDQLTEALEPLFDNARARLIAISETTDTYMAGANFAKEELVNQGYDAVLVWITVRDSKVCQICEPRDGKEQGDGWEDPEKAHPGCRCEVVVEIRE
jgi:hypothetical protein